MYRLENLKWSPRWVSHLGCVKGCLDYLGMDMTDAWLYGGTGHAFIINISADSCPSGPTAWMTKMLFEGGWKLGYGFEMVMGRKQQAAEFPKLQAEAWKFTKSNLDQGYPVYGWELDIPEFYVVNGYDEVGYYYSGPGADDGAGPKPWGELGNTNIGLIEIYSVKPGEPQPDSVVVKSALQNALKHASNPEEWIYPNYASGLKGYDNWIKGLESGKADRFGMGYNAAVWLECRKYAAAFLKEAKERLEGAAGDLFEGAAGHYQAVADLLGKVSESYPFIPNSGPEVIAVNDQSREVVGWLRAAREAEAAGLRLLDYIQATL